MIQLALREKRTLEKNSHVMIEISSQSGSISGMGEGGRGVIPESVMNC
jgi:hypothetical protein